MPEQAGFCGKLPARGDFIRRGLSETLVSCWDNWVARNLAYTHTVITQDEWIKGWVIAPLWRLSLPAGHLSEQPVSGLIMPSIDKAGRYFPFFAGVEGASAAINTGSFWHEMEHTCRDALMHTIEPDELFLQLQNIPAPEETSCMTEQGLWMTEGNNTIPAQTLTYQELPEQELFAKLFWA
ncbi:type VI secretion system-associated protein TagF [Acetobacter thailandicus]|uniref:type VI secretion system-associated protein TagF n=1 Tax=Acetobacter thailandicus TaxID=1502842 RepID=UPI001BAA94D0|nr:type VI secretion system-associated protein TagF [Acetobacter thailandicus]MBS0979652.1 type VI secretion system-associated protein TagF [Acetobacter thailandicus]